MTAEMKSAKNCGCVDSGLRPRVESRPYADGEVILRIIRQQFLRSPAFELARRETYSEQFWRLAAQRIVQ